MLTTLVILGQVCVFLYSNGAGHLLQNLVVVLALFVATLLLVALVVGLVLIFSGRLLGRIIKVGIEKYDQGVLGVEVEFGHLEVALHKGKVFIKELIVKNPQPYSSEYLLNAHEVLVDIDVTILVLSKFRKIELESLVFKNVDVIWEKNGLQDSNVRQVLEHVESRRAEIQGGPVVSLEQRVAERLQQELRQKAAVAANELCEMAAVTVGIAGRQAYGLGALAAQRFGITSGSSSAEPPDEQPNQQATEQSNPSYAESPPRERHNSNSAEDAEERGAGDERPEPRGEQPKSVVRIQQLTIEGVGVKWASTLHQGNGVRLALADMKFEDFTKEKENGWTIDEMVILILHSFLQTLVVNTLGRRLGTSS